MKKYFILALFCAFLVTVPAAAQKVTCTDCTHQMPVYYGEGGFIAEATDADEMVVWLASCDGVTRTGELEPDDDGIVSALLMGDLACMSTDKDGNADGIFEVGPVEDGGWYWVTMETNSAVGGLVAKNILENDNMVMPTSAGDGVTMTGGMGAVLLTETATGRAGILPTILPVDPEEVNTCSYTSAGTPAVHTRETANCMLGDGKTVLLVQGPTNIFTGKRSTLGANGRVVRPASGNVTVHADLWGNGTGHFTADSSGDARLGHPGGTRLTATITAELVGDGAAADQNIDGTGPNGAAGAGLTFGLDADSTPSLGVLTIVHDPAYCNPTTKPPVNHAATVKFTATVDDTGRALVTPSIVTTPATGSGVATTHTITVVCPSAAAAANMGTDLVPENPFPTDR